MLNKYKETWKYISGSKKYLFSMVIFLILFQITSVTSPLVIQKIIDNNILIINDTWYEVEVNKDDVDNKTVLYNDKYYKNIKKLTDDDNIKNEVSIVYIDGNYYFSNEKIQGKNKHLSKNTLITSTGQYNVQKLTNSDIRNFYTSISSDIKKLLLLLFAVLISNIIFSFLQRINGAYLNINVTKNMRLKAAHNMEYMKIKNLEDDPAGKLANRFISDSIGVGSLYNSTINIFLSSVLSIVLSFIAMIILSPMMALICGIILPIMYVWIKFFVRKMRKIAEKINETNSQMIASFNEIINGIFILKVFNSQKQTINKFEKLNDKYVDESIEEVNLHITKGWNAINLFQGLMIALVIIIFSLLDLTSSAVIEVGIIYAFYNYIGKIIAPINILFHEFSNIEHSYVKFKRIDKLTSAKTEEEFHKINDYKGDLQFKDVTFSYENNKPVLQNININIKQGQKIGIIGRTGAGKSTIINLLLRFNELNENKNNKGEILIDEKSIYTNSKRTYRQHLGVLLQEAIIFKGTIASNVKMGKDISDEKVVETLNLIGGQKLLAKFDNDVTKEIKNRGLNLSLGEKQIIAFARVIIHDPKILIMDEATANIDTETEKIITKALNIVCKNRTTIVIAHRLSTIKDSDQILLLKDGQILERGNHEQLLSKKEFYYEMWMNQYEN